MKLGVVVYSTEPETISNALELASYALVAGSQAKVFLLGRGVEAGAISKTEGYARQPFRIAEQMQAFSDSGGTIYVSGKCLESRELGVPDVCVPSAVKELYEFLLWSDRVISF